MTKLEKAIEIAKQKGYTFEYVIEATECDAHNMSYFDPNWAIDEDELAEYPDGREVTVSGDFDGCSEAIFERTRNEKGLVIGLL